MAFHRGMCSHDTIYYARGRPVDSETGPDFPSTFDGLLQLVKTLREPGGCPWDREQNRQTMKRYVMEECFELIDAMESDEPSEIAGEIGDVAFNLAFQIQLAKENDEFEESAVFGAIIEKLTRRHPHVFGDVEVSGSGEVLDNWREIKKAERGADQGALAGVPLALPALNHAQAIQDRAAGVGFDWEDQEGVLAKVSEELQELATADTHKEREAELGDLLFSIVNAARWMDIDAESALRGTANRFRQRFRSMEQMADKEDATLADLELDAKEALWQRAKGAAQAE
jgi:tetrapyrrole methylase family protein/MazG family protein